MSLEIAVDRLNQTGWMASGNDLERLSDGRPYPSIYEIQAEFSRAGLELALKQNLMFDCFRATWAPIGEPLDPQHAVDDQHGTVVGSCEEEAAVYALAQLRSAQLEHQLSCG